MKKIVSIIMILGVISIFTISCSKENTKSDLENENKVVQSTEDNTKELETVYKAPELKDVIFPGLHSADITFSKGMAYESIDIPIYSTEELDTDNVKLSLEGASALKYDFSVYEVLDPYEPQSFSLPLLRAYNGLETKSDYDYYDAYDLNVSNIKTIYRYVAMLKFDLNKSYNKEFNNITIEYNGKKYTYDIGTIKLDNSNKIDRFNYDDSLLWSNGVSYTGMSASGKGSIFTDVDYALTTTNKEVTIDKLELQNVDWSCDKIIVHIENENGSIETEYDGSEIVIPQNSNVNFEIVYKENHPENNGSAYSPILKIDYSIGNKSYTFKFMFLTETTESAYETYAYLFDNIDLYNLYQKYE